MSKHTETKGVKFLIQNTNTVTLHDLRSMLNDVPEGSYFLVSKEQLTLVVHGEDPDTHIADPGEWLWARTHDIGEEETRNVSVWPENEFGPKAPPQP